MSRARVLVVEDDEDILELVEYNLAKEGHEVIRAGSGEKALELARTKGPDLVLLDLMLPGMDGLDVCRGLRARPETQHLPVIMITARTEEADIVSGLELGADDYLTKPFSPRVLLARVKAVLRRRRAEPAGGSEATTVGDLAIHPGRREVLVSGSPVQLTFTEFALLQLLAHRPGWVFTRAQIVDALHGSEYAVTERAVDVHVVNLRKKLAHCSSYLETVRGVGYRLKG